MFSSLIPPNTLNFFRLQTWVFSYFPKVMLWTTAGLSNFKIKNWRQKERTRKRRREIDKRQRAELWCCYCVCGGLQVVASSYSRPVTLCARFAHYLNDYSRVNLLRQMSGTTHNLWAASTCHWWFNKPGHPMTNHQWPLGQNEWRPQGEHWLIVPLESRLLTNPRDQCFHIHSKEKPSSIWEIIHESFYMNFTFNLYHEWKTTRLLIFLSGIDRVPRAHTARTSHQAPAMTHMFKVIIYRS